jgi:hypothetical protein
MRHACSIGHVLHRELLRIRGPEHDLGGRIEDGRPRSIDLVRSLDQNLPLDLMS